MGLDKSKMQKAFLDSKGVTKPGDNGDKFAAADKYFTEDKEDTELVLVSVKLAPQDNQIVRKLTKVLTMRDFTKVKQSEIIRLGLSMLAELSDDQIVEKFIALPKIKPGPNKKK